jgi:hypothetical protein
VFVVPWWLEASIESQIGPHCTPGENLVQIRLPVVSHWSHVHAR